MDAKQSLRLGVVGLELVIANRPGRRDAVLALEDPEVLAPEARQGSAVDLGAAPDDVIDRRPKRLAAPIDEWIGGAVALRDEELPRAPVLGLPRQVVAPLDDEDLRAAVAQRVGKRAAAHPTADDDDVGRDGRRVCSHRHCWHRRERPATCLPPSLAERWTQLNDGPEPRASVRA